MNGQRGFTLLEMGIVLGIIGLMIGGILTGTAVIHTAHLQAVLSEYSRYVEAADMFRRKYNSLPGDMPNATSFWGAANADPTTCQTTASTGKETCDGNGDGLVTGSGNYEAFRFWQHLANGDFLEVGSYSGVFGGATVPGVNVPASEFHDGGWSVVDGATMIAYVAGSTAWFAADYTHHPIFLFGGSSSDTSTDGALLSAKDGWNLDQKIDDGKPATGKVIAGYFSSCTTATSQNDLQAEYKVSGYGRACVLFFTHTGM